MRAKAAAAGFPSQTITEEQFQELEEKQQVGRQPTFDAWAGSSTWQGDGAPWGVAVHGRTPCSLLAGRCMLWGGPVCRPSMCIIYFRSWLLKPGYLLKPGRIPRYAHPRPNGFAQVSVVLRESVLWRRRLAYNGWLCC